MSDGEAEGGAPSPQPGAIDLTGEGAVGAYAVKVQDLDERREDTRTLIATALVVLLGLVVIGIGAGIMIWPDKIGVFEKYLTMVFAPLVGLVGTVSGFYFGEKSAERKKDR